MSITITGIVVTFLSWLLSSSGIELATESLQNFVEVFGVLIGIVVSYYGRWRHGDITVMGMKK